MGSGKSIGLERERITGLKTEGCGIDQHPTL
jgi:hypothetical protein